MINSVLTVIMGISTVLNGYNEIITTKQGIISFCPKEIYQQSKELEKTDEFLSERLDLALKLDKIHHSNKKNRY